MGNNTSFVAFSKPFVDAGRKVFETMISSSLETQKPYLKEGRVSTADISASLGVTGTVETDGKTISYQAMMVLSWPEATYLKIASAMLYEEFTEYVEEIQDVGGEISNMIMGNAKATLSTMGYTTSMAIPIVTRGKSHSINYPQGCNIIVIPIKTAHGEMFMDICFSLEE